ncbi:UDP-N-acetylmuramate dehydrogenase [Pseudoramibacter porci]|uniref:UDP-N-acetylenolpyruvoylglucosamine reductase n=1 Tax=Pseudoramibacter porci TaxID=2606631 RepID=A0A7X2TAA7_9FIRM|nr:UDP-N-acetylmuramate dehydrogenase [Pseudoramibacter porci]MSS20242.1 UDP-N-acetylmuramate dehydrogenase [Pseudoramibacter porci]
MKYQFDKNKVKNKLLEIVSSDQLLTDSLMRDHTTFRVGGPADFIVFPENQEQLAEIAGLCCTNEIPFFLMGNGSNLLVRDGGFRGVIINTRQMTTVVTDGSRVVAQAGALLRAVAKEALAHSLKGFEFASGIPGTIGGAAIMNAGAYGGEMKDVIAKVHIMTPDGKFETVDGRDCHFGYRQSRMRDACEVVTAVELALEPGDPETIRARMQELNQRRRDKQPLNYPSAGSTFKRPEGYFAGKLIQDAGLKGYRVGGAMVSQKHSGFVINADGATAADVLQLIGDVQRKVKAQFGVDLEPEVITIGEDIGDEN